MVRQLLNVGVGSIIGSNVIGAIPNVGNNTAVTNLKNKTAEGFGEVGKQLPTMGKLKGAGMVLKPLKKLKSIKFGKVL